MTREEEDLFQKIVNLKKENEMLLVLYEELDELLKTGYTCYICEDKLSGLLFAFKEYKKWKKDENPT